MDVLEKTLETGLAGFLLCEEMLTPASSAHLVPSVLLPRELNSGLVSLEEVHDDGVWRGSPTFVEYAPRSSAAATLEGLACAYVVGPCKVDESFYKPPTLGIIVQRLESVCSAFSDHLACLGCSRLRWSFPEYPSLWAFLDAVSVGQLLSVANVLSSECPFPQDTGVAQHPKLWQMGTEPGLPTDTFIVNPFPLRQVVRSTLQ